MQVVAEGVAALEGGVIGLAGVTREADGGPVVDDPSDAAGVGLARPPGDGGERFEERRGFDAGLFTNRLGVCANVAARARADPGAAVANRPPACKSWRSNW